MKRLGALVLVAVVGLVAGPGPAWSQQTAERFILKTTDPTANTGTVVATGPITGVGRYVLEGQGPEPIAGKFVFDGGTVFLTVTPNPPSMNFDPRACLLRLGTSATIAITGGTGAFAGARGSGRSVGRAVVGFSRDSRGECELHKKPVFFVGIVDITANVTVPSGRVAT